MKIKTIIVEIQYVNLSPHRDKMTPEHIENALENYRLSYTNTQNCPRAISVKEIKHETLK